MIKYTRLSARVHLLNIVNLAWRTKQIPTAWSNAAIILPVYKKGNTKKCSNYRGILLICGTAKVYETIIEERFRTETEHRLQDEQNGFRRNHNIQDDTLIL